MNHITIKCAMVMIAAVTFAGCATTEAPKAAASAKPVKSVEPVLSEVKGDPNPFADYTKGMASDANLPMAVEWHNRNAATLTKETDVESLKRLATSAQELESLLAQVKPDYRTDPMVAVKIAAVSQIAMCRKWDKAPAVRERWTAALLKSAAAVADDYRKMFFLDQLRWCGKRDQSAAVLRVGRESGSKAVSDFAKMVVKEMK